MHEYFAMIELPRFRKYFAGKITTADSLTFGRRVRLELSGFYEYASVVDLVEAYVPPFGPRCLCLLALGPLSEERDMQLLAHIMQERKFTDDTLRHIVGIVPEDWMRELHLA